MIYTITLGFVPSRIWAKSAEQYYATAKTPTKHFFIDQCYPLDEQQNREELQKICAKHNIEVLAPGSNLGLHHGFNWALKQIGVSKDDLVIAYDPDARPVTPGWDEALLRCLGEPDVAWASVMLQHMWDCFITGHPYRDRKVGNLHTFEIKQAIMNSICAWTGEYLLLSGGLKEPTEFYGGLECSMWNSLIDQKKNWVFLRDFWEDHEFHLLQDPQYRDWKWAHAHLGSWKGDFKSFLEAGCPMPKQPPKGY